jgi:dissimilatory sulfite reductase (desulfoviridin) alpha/beta subunit
MLGSVYRAWIASGLHARFATTWWPYSWRRACISGCANCCMQRAHMKGIVKEDLLFLTVQMVESFN